MWHTSKITQKLRTTHRRDSQFCKNYNRFLCKHTHHTTPHTAASFRKKRRRLITVFAEFHVTAVVNAGNLKSPIQSAIVYSLHHYITKPIDAQSIHKWEKLENKSEIVSPEFEFRESVDRYPHSAPTIFLNRLFVAWIPPHSHSQLQLTYRLTNLAKQNCSLIQPKLFLFSQFTETEMD